MAAPGITIQEWTRRLFEWICHECAKKEYPAEYAAFRTQDSADYVIFRMREVARDKDV